ncbi:DNA translocase FtsK 4TM domain-containing protein [Sodaliphilus sp.]|uniref:FtsK/SpoIIIE family DNA translocase n=1 Tax=Sodaliphilus sp. TaxID=2815818 RepID=UPI00388EAED8
MNNETYNPNITNAKKGKGAPSGSGKNDQEGKLTFINRISVFFSSARTRIVLGIILALFAIYLLISFVSFFAGAGIADQNMVSNYDIVENAQQPDQISNLGAAVGAWASDHIIANGVGVAAVILVIWSIVIAARLFRNEKVHFFSYTLMSIFSTITFSILIGALTYGIDYSFFHLGGAFGYYTNKWLIGAIGYIGMIAVNIILLVIWGMLCYKTIMLIYTKTKEVINRKKFDGDDVDENAAEQNVESLDEVIGRRQYAVESQPEKTSKQEDEEKTSFPFMGKKPEKKKVEKKKQEQPQVQASSEPAVMAGIESGEVSNPNDPTGEYIHYKFPSLDLLENRTMSVDRVDVEEQESNKNRIIETLGHYGIQIKHIDVHVGPTVTLFEIIPEDGVKVSKIRNLEDDIALSLAALGIRIIAPMPGRGTIGIEVPNRDPQVVPMRQVLASKKFQETKCKLPMCLGCTVTNEVFVADLTKMPHLLVAGATGKGKSVGLNAIITSLLYSKGPSELKFVLVDPKRVEFSVYADLEKYFFAKPEDEDRAIVTQTDKVVKVLNCLVQEMENRYEVLEEVKVRTVEDYNAKWRQGLRNERDGHGDKKYPYMPYIVAIIDEFSDMMMTAGKEVETPIIRIAQKARAVGIHMIIATQRPSVQVVTGLIRANFPGRVAFAVSSSTDSRIILDAPGAHRLIGRGDMLFSVNGETTRLQCPFIDTKEIVDICDFIREQEENDRNIEHEHPFYLPEYVGETENNGGGGDASSLKDRDPLFEEAVRYIVQGDVASTSSLQRRYEIGYNRAGRIMDQMEAAGIVGPATGGKPRKVLISPADAEGLLSTL